MQYTKQCNAKSNRIQKYNAKTKNGMKVAKGTKIK